MAEYRIEFTEDADGDLRWFSAFEQKQIVGDIRSQLCQQPEAETRNRKRLRGHPLARWELRTGQYRTFYEVMEATRTVRIVAVGEKDRADIYVRGKKLEL